MPAESRCEDCGRRHALNYEEWRETFFGDGEQLCGNAGGDLVNKKGRDISWNEDADHEDAILACFEEANRLLCERVKAAEAATELGKQRVDAFCFFLRGGAHLAQQHGDASKAQTYLEVERDLDTMANGSSSGSTAALSVAGLLELEALARDFLSRGMVGVTVPPALLLHLIARAQVLSTQ